MCRYNSAKGAVSVSDNEYVFKNGTTYDAALRMGTRYCASSSDMLEACA